MKTRISLLEWRSSTGDQWRNCHSNNKTLALSTWGRARVWDKNLRSHAGYESRFCLVIVRSGIGLVSVRGWKGEVEILLCLCSEMKHARDDDTLWGFPAGDIVWHFQRLPANENVKYLILLMAFRVLSCIQHVLWKWDNNNRADPPWLPYCKGSMELWWSDDQPEILSCMGLAILSVIWPCWMNLIERAWENVGNPHA